VTKGELDQKLFDEVLSGAIDVLRLSANERARIVRRLKVLEAALIKKLSDRTLTELSKREVERVLEETDKIIDDAYEALQEQIDYPAISETVAEATAQSLEVTLGKDAVAIPKPDYFKAVASDVLIQGAPSRDWWRGQDQDTQRRFAAEVRKGLQSGETNQQIITRIVGSAGVPGVMDTARRNAAALVQTSVQTVANDARRATFDANPDVIKGLKQVSTLDGHTTLICVSYSGAEWNLKREPINGNDLPFNGGTPRHWNCRSLEIPITKSLRDLGIDLDDLPPSTRASSSGQISVNTSFNDYLKRRGKAYQDEVLGKGRADLWRAGKITLRDLVNGDGRPLSLAEIQARVQRKKR
jgi:hypothetical protein